MSQAITADGVQRLLEIDDKIKHVADELKRLKEDRRSVEDTLVEEWATVGKQSENRDGKTIYRARDLQCSTRAGQSEVLKAACKAEGLEEFVKESVVMASLKSWVRENAELDDTGELVLASVPESIQKSINVFERHVIRVRRSK